MKTKCRIWINYMNNLGICGVHPAACALELHVKRSIMTLYENNAHFPLFEP